MAKRARRAVGGRRRHPKGGGGLRQSDQDGRPPNALTERATRQPCGEGSAGLGQGAGDKAAEAPGGGLAGPAGSSTSAEWGREGGGAHMGGGAGAEPPPVCCPARRGGAPMCGGAGAEPPPQLPARGPARGAQPEGRPGRASYGFGGTHRCLMACPNYRTFAAIRENAKFRLPA